MIQRIFISSVQREFADERRAVCDFVRGDILLRRFFDVFLFEDLPASDRKVKDVYLDEVGRCALYVGLFGQDYGHEDSTGISPTEREFDQATALGKTRLIFVKEMNDADRNARMSALISKASTQLIRHPFAGITDLNAALYASLVEYLEHTGRIRTKPFDAAACPDAKLSDLSREKVSDFLERAQAERDYALGPKTSTRKALAHLNLLDGDQPSHAAVLLFARNPQHFLLSSEVKCMHFHGTEVRKPIPSYQIYHGTVFELVDQAVDFVMSKIDRTVGTRALGPQAPVDYELPREAVAEAIVNAVTHRDYTSNASVQVMLFSDRLEVWNPGELPPPLTVTALRVPHASIPHNPLIADPMFLAHYAEKAGSGILDMISRCQQAGLPAPQFRQEGGQFIQTIWRPKRTVTSQVEAQEAQVEAQEAQAKLPATDVVLLKACLERPQSGQELLQAAGYSKRSGNFKRSIGRLLAAGYVEMILPDRPTSHLQKYRLTMKGRSWLATATKGNEQ